MKKQRFIYCLLYFVFYSSFAQTQISEGENTISAFDTPVYYIVENDNTLLRFDKANNYLTVGIERSGEWIEHSSYYSYSDDSTRELLVMKGDLVGVDMSKWGPGAITHFDMSTLLLTDLCGRTADNPQILLPGENIIKFCNTYFSYTFPSDGTVSFDFLMQDEGNYKYFHQFGYEVYEIPVFTTIEDLKNYSQYLTIDQSVYQTINPRSKDKISGKTGQTLYFKLTNTPVIYNQPQGYYQLYHKPLPEILKLSFSAEMQQAGSNTQNAIPLRIGTNRIQALVRSDKTFYGYEDQHESYYRAYLKYTADRDTAIVLMNMDKYEYASLRFLGVSSAPAYDKDGELIGKIIGDRIDVSKDSTYYLLFTSQLNPDHTNTDIGNQQFTIEIAYKAAPLEMDYCNIPVVELEAEHSYNYDLTGTHAALYSYSAPKDGYLLINFSNGSELLYSYKDCSSFQNTPLNSLNHFNSAYPIKMHANDTLNLMFTNKNTGSFSVNISNNLFFKDVEINSARAVVVDDVKGTISGEILQSSDIRNVLFSAKLPSGGISYSIDSSETTYHNIYTYLDFSTGSHTITLENAFGEQKTYTLIFTQAEPSSEAKIHSIQINNQIGETVQIADTFKITIPTEDYWHIRIDNSSGSSVDGANYIETLLEDGVFGSDSVIYCPIQVTSEDKSTLSTYYLRLSILGLDGHNWQNAIEVYNGINENENWKDHTCFYYVPLETSVIRIQNPLIDPGSKIDDVEIIFHLSSSDDEKVYDFDEKGMVSIKVTANDTVYFFSYDKISSFEIEQPLGNELHSGTDILGINVVKNRNERIYFRNETVQIDTLTHTVNIFVDYGMAKYRNCLDVDFELSPWARLHYKGKEIEYFSNVNFWNTVTVTVIAENGDKQVWGINVRPHLPNTEKLIKQFVLPDQLSNSIIDSANNTVRIFVDPNADISNVAPFFMISENASLFSKGIKQNSYHTK